MPSVAGFARILKFMPGYTATDAYRGVDLFIRVFEGLRWEKGLSCVVVVAGIGAGCADCVTEGCVSTYVFVVEDAFCFMLVSTF